MMRFLIMMVMLMALLSLAACGSDEELAKGEHVWKEQTQALDKAKEVEGMLKQRASELMNKADEASE